MCRLQGDLVQAGRWTYLADERRAREVAAVLLLVLGLFVIGVIDGLRVAVHWLG